MKKNNGISMLFNKKKQNHIKQINLSFSDMISDYNVRVKPTNQSEMLTTSSDLFLEEKC